MGDSVMVSVSQLGYLGLKRSRLKPMGKRFAAQVSDMQPNGRDQTVRCSCVWTSIIIASSSSPTGNDDLAYIGWEVGHDEEIARMRWRGHQLRMPGSQ